MIGFGGILCYSGNKERILIVKGPTLGFFSILPTPTAGASGEGHGMSRV